MLGSGLDHPPRTPPLRGPSPLGPGRSFSEKHDWRWLLEKAKQMAEYYITTGKGNKYENRKIVEK